jgi:hypothetical protein
LLVGGTLLNGETVSPHEKRNGTIHAVSARSLVRGTWSAFHPGYRIRFCWRAPMNLTIL